MRQRKYENRLLEPLGRWDAWDDEQAEYDYILKCFYSVEWKNVVIYFLGGIASTAVVFAAVFILGYFSRSEL